MAGALCGLAAPAAAQSRPADAGPDEWPTAGRDLRNSRAATSSSIRSDTVDGVTERWRVPLDGFGSLSTVPIVVDGTVIVSSVPVSIGGIYQPGDRGVVYALDAETGAVKWTFDTVKGDDLWDHPEVNSGGGAWYPPAVDEKRGLLYVGVANPAPFPGTPEYPNGTSRPGDNLYTDSIVALDLETGALRWFHQVTKHDIFDRDQVHALIAEVRGRDVVVSAGKSGVLVGLDPRSGKVRWRTEVGRHEHDDLTALDGPTLVYPGTYGGVLTHPRLPTASSTPPWSTRPPSWSRTRPRTSARSSGPATARWWRSTPARGRSGGRPTSPAIRSAAPRSSATWW